MWPAIFAAIGETLASAELPAALAEAGVTPEAVSMANEASGAIGGNGGLLGLFNQGADAAKAAFTLDALKQVLPKTAEEMMAAGKQASGIEPVEKVIKTAGDPALSFRAKFDALAPEAYKQSMTANSLFNQLQQSGQPMQTASYATPYRPYQGGGINEILSRQNTLLR